MNHWELRWHEGRIGFHLSEVNPYLIRYYEKISKKELKKIFVPLCGKSLDLIWLAERIKKVVGVEIVKKPVEDFFAENNIRFNKKYLGKLELFQSDSIDVYRGDFFDLNENETGRFDAIYDRASIVGIDPLDRSNYVDHIMKFLKDGGQAILITLEYDQDLMKGPPFSIPFMEIKKLFSKFCNLELLETQNILDERLRAKGLDEILERVIKITKK